MRPFRFYFSNPGHVTLPVPSHWDRWSKGGVPISEANGDSLEVTVDHSYFTDPVSCEVSNSVGSTNVSTLVDVQCKCGSSGVCVKLAPDSAVPAALLEPDPGH